MYVQRKPAKGLNMRRREVVMGAAGGLAWGVAVPWGYAQERAAAAPMPAITPVELEDYVVLDKPVSVSLPPGKKVELIEFFWYECPHCYAFEPILVEWLRTLPADVAFRHVPVGFTSRHVPAQRLYCALQLTGQAEALHRRVYDAIHQRYSRIAFDWEMGALVSSLGGDGARLREVLRSPELAAAVRRANERVEAFEVDGVPTFGIQGRFRSSPAMTGGRERALRVAEVLMERARQPA